MKSIKRISLLSLLAIFWLSFFVSGVNAQEDQTNIIPEIAIPEGMEVVAIGDFSKAEIISQDNNKFKIAFELKNFGKMVTDLRYGVKLEKRVGEEYQQIDEKVFDEVVSLNNNQSINREIEYIAPDFLQGEFRLSLVSKDSAILTFAANPVGKRSIVLNGTGEYIQFPSDCFLTIGVKEEKYPLSQFVSFESNEEVFLNCQFENMGQNPIIAQANFEVYSRNTFNQEEKTISVSSENVSISSKEKKEVRIKLPQVEKPQGYDIKVSLEKEGKKVSNSVIAHFVLAGESASIVMTRFDKDAYQKNETANLEITTERSIEFYTDATAGNVGENIVLEVEISNNLGKSCADKLTQDIAADSDIHNKINLAIPIKEDCLGMKALISLKKKDGKELDKKTISLPLIEKKVKPPIEKVEESGLAKKIGWGIGILCLVASLLAFIFYRFKNKNNSAVSLFFLLFIASFFFFSDAQATSYTLSDSINDHYIQATFYVNPAPEDDWDTGEKITISSSAYYKVPTDRHLKAWVIFNSNVLGSITTCTKGSGQNVAVEIPTSTTTMNAPPSSGSYTYSMSILMYVYAGSACGELNQTLTKTQNISVDVVAPIPVVGSCGTRNTTYSSSTTTWPASSTYCNSGDAWPWPAFPNQGETVYWTCYGLNGGANASCSATRLNPAVNGSCGTRATTYSSTTTSWPAGNFCAAGTASPVSPTFPSIGGSTSWTCLGSSGGANVSCSAVRKCSVTLNTSSSSVVEDESYGTGITWSTSGATSCWQWRNSSPAGEDGITGNISPYPEKGWVSSVQQATAISSGPLTDSSYSFNLNCYGPGGASSVCTDSKTVQVLSCGTADGVSTATEPAVSLLCPSNNYPILYEPSAVTSDSTTWNWSCTKKTATSCTQKTGAAGVCNTATCTPEDWCTKTTSLIGTVSCSAPKLIEENCGTANGVSTATEPAVSLLCPSDNYPISYEPSLVTNNPTTWDWSCTKKTATSCTQKAFVPGTCNTATCTPEDWCTKITATVGTYPCSAPKPATAFACGIADSNDSLDYSPSGYSYSGTQLCSSGTSSQSLVTITKPGRVNWTCSGSGIAYCNACMKLDCNSVKNDYCKGQEIVDGCGGTCSEVGIKHCDESNPDGNYDARCCDGGWIEVKP